MKSNENIDRILATFRTGQGQQSEELFFAQVVPLFVPGNDLFDSFNATVRNAFTSAFIAGGASESESILRWVGISEIIQTGIEDKIGLGDIEARLLDFYRAFIKPARTEINQVARANRCFETVRPHLLGETIVDYGCGKGLLGAKIAETMGKKVLLVDNIDFNKSNLPLLRSNRLGQCQLADSIADTAIAYLVLHHMDNPLDGLRELSRIAQTRIILMEGWVEELQWRYVNQTIDWFFNRILLGVDMNVPLNFLKVKDWAALIEHVGFQVTLTNYLGADEELAPEHHVLIVADRK